MTIVERQRGYYDPEWETIRELPGDEERFETIYSTMLDEGWSIHETARGETYRQVIMSREDDMYDLTLCKEW